MTTRGTPLRFTRRQFASSLILPWLLAPEFRAAAREASDALDLPPPYQPDAMVSGNIRIWGHGSYGNRVDFIEQLVRSWEAGFKRYQPQVSFEDRLVGTASAIGALYTGVGDLALMGREIWPNEVNGFKEVTGHLPLGVDVVTGSFNVRNRGYALVVFVHRSNPLAHLTLTQLAGIYGADAPRGGRLLRRWGELGLTGQWADRGIVPYGLPIARGFAEYFEDRVFRGQHKWNTALREFGDDPGSTGGPTDGGQHLLNALAMDPAGIGYAGLMYHHPDVKVVALSDHGSSRYVAPTLESVRDHSYPLTRMITMFLDRTPGSAVEPKLAEFLRYVLSREGQQAVIQDGQGYLPMLRAAADAQLLKLR